MNKGLKIFIFIFIFIVLGGFGAIIKSYIVFPYYSIVALILTFMYWGMFKKGGKKEELESHSPNPSVESGAGFSKERSSGTTENKPCGQNEHKQSNFHQRNSNDYQGEMDSIKRQRKILLDLKGDNLLTQDEYKDKVAYAG